ncbi:MAG: hypothetical protein JWO15_2494 [Sphingomonadales bacterium]|nr:hypothetical protein [Sphingomonadales bacterium]
MSDIWPSRVDRDTAPYWEGLTDRKLILTRCQDCQYWIHPPRACCPSCWSDNVGHDTPSGRATLYSYIVQPIAPGEPPSVIGWAELEEQERLLVVAPITGGSADTVRIGEALTLDWAPSRNLFLPIFRQEPQS